MDCRCSGSALSGGAPDGLRFQLNNVFCISTADKLTIIFRYEERQLLLLPTIPGPQAHPAEGRALPESG